VSTCICFGNIHWHEIGSKNVCLTALEHCAKVPLSLFAAQKKVLFVCECNCHASARHEPKHQNTSLVHQT